MGKPWLRLLPSRKDPHVRRWQDVAGRFHDPDEPDHGWLDFDYDAPAFREHFAHIPGGTLDELARAARSRTLGFSHRDYVWSPRPARDPDPTATALFKYPESKAAPEALARLGASNPDELFARLTGTAFPALAAGAAPENSFVEVTGGSDEDPDVEAWYIVLDEDGNDLCRLHRHWAFEAQRPYVHNAELRLADRLHGSGLASAMYGSQESLARSLKLEKSTLFANMNVGGYAWPHLGYDFLGSEGRGYVHDLMQEHLEGLRWRLAEPWQRTELANEVYGMQHAWDFARFEVPREYAPDLADEERRVGKRVMLGLSYQAQKDFDSPLAQRVTQDTVERRAADARRRLGRE